MKPMLATRYELSQVKFPCVVQPKYDGVRCIVSVGDDGEVHLTSRTGKEYDVPQIKEWAEKHRDILPLDGEIYAHKTLTFQQLCSAVKCDSEWRKKLYLVVYDRPIQSLSYKERTHNLKRYIPLHCQYPVRLTPEFTCMNERGIEIFHKVFVDSGYEGLIVRNVDASYVEGRSNDLMKLKKFDTTEFEIVDVLEAAGNDAGTGIFKLRVKEFEFCARPTGDKELRASYLRNREQLIGKKATLQHQGYTDAGIPRFPVVLTVRDYE